jgi:hypothetical protein
MGSLFYGNTREPIEIPDRMLAHLKVVAATKLRRGESFTFTWQHADGAGRSTIWMQPAIALRFVFDSVEPEMLDSGYLKELAEQASSAHGVNVTLTDLKELERAA